MGFTNESKEELLTLVPIEVALRILRVNTMGLT